MNNQIHLSIVTSAGTVFDGPADYIEIPLQNGSIGVLPGHAATLGAVTDGVVLARRDGSERYIAVGRGVANIAHNEVTLLVRTAERAEDIDAARAAAAEKRARGYLADKAGHWNMDRAEMALRRSLARQSAVLMLKRRS